MNHDTQKQTTIQTTEQRGAEERGRERVLYMHIAFGGTRRVCTYPVEMENEKIFTHARAGTAHRSSYGWGKAFFPYTVNRIGR